MKSLKSASEEKKLNRSPYNNEELGHFRTLLLEKRIIAENELERLRTSLQEHSELETDEKLLTLDMGDIGTDVEDQDTTYTLLERTRKYIIEINEALERIEKGTYGICQATGKKISKQRLESVPHTRFSIDAKQRGLAD